MRFFRVSLFFTAFVLFCSVALPLWRLFPELYGNPVVPLHYNIHYGVDGTGVWWQIFTLPVMGVGFVVVNILLAFFFARRDVVLTTIILVANIVLALLIFTAMVFVVSLNIVYG